MYNSARMFGENPTFALSETYPASIRNVIVRCKNSPYTVSLACGLVVLGLLCNYVLSGRTTNLHEDIGVTGLALLLVLAGMLLGVRVLWPQMTPTALLAIGIICATIYCLVYVFTLGLLFVSSRGDYGHCEQMIHGVAATASIPPSAFDPAHPAAFCLEGNYGLFRTRYQILQIYGVAERKTQDAILVSLNRVRQAENTESIQVLFYERENVHLWHNDKNGASGGTRGPEILLRTAVVH